jgi:two-component system KDP operon response regulator KdpE
LLLAGEPGLRRMLRTALNHGGAQLLECRSEREALELIEVRRPELLLVDLRISSDDSGLVRTLRASTNASILAISQNVTEEHVIAVLDAGADDIMVIPFSKNEMLARIRAALRRSQRAHVEPPLENFRAGALEIDFVAREVRLRNKPIHLTPTEYKLLGVLAAGAGKVVTHQRLLEEVWGGGAVEQVQYLRVYMKQLRRKLELSPGYPQCLVTEPGVGYRLRLPT